MSYHYSNTDRNNINWFHRDQSNQTLLSLALKGAIRGVQNCKIKFNYPISIISGRNGSGKSTILSLAACAYHNKDSGFKLHEKENTYYTFSDFFIQSSEEIKPDGIQIWYEILHNKWNATSKLPNGIGAGFQKREKKKGGRWNNYERRVNRNVVFLGIDRIVPYSEKTVVKTYNSKFKLGTRDGIEESIIDDVGYILDKDYSDLNFKKHGKYKLPLVVSSETTYSGFNMGAGENTLFELFHILHRLPKGSLIIIDEIELGLYDEAQRKLIERLKEICLSKHHQIIATSHSSEIIKSVPPEGRIHIESFEFETILSPGISAAYATGKLKGENSNELDIYVEDPIAEAFVRESLSFELRERVNIIPIGSSTAVLRQMSSRYKDLKHGNSITILDGDKSSKHTKNINEFINNCESFPDTKSKELANDWISKRLNYLPGTNWPENYILKEIAKNDLTEFASSIGLQSERLRDIIYKSIRAGKHNEFYDLSKSCNLNREYLISDALRCLKSQKPNEFNRIEEFVKGNIT